MIKIGILRGGPSSEYQISLKTGQSVLDNFPEEFELGDILVDKSGDWHLEGLPIIPQKAVQKFDIFFNCLHGAYGEDGKIQQFFDSLNTPYTGSGALGSALAMNKFLAKRTFAMNKIKVPEHESLKASDDLDNDLKRIFRSRTLPIIIKPMNNGSSLGVSLARDFLELQEGVAKAFEYADEIIVEEYIRGREATCGVLENFRGEDLYSFFPVEIVKAQNSGIFDYDTKYEGKSQEIIPGRFSQAEKKEIQRLSKLAHKVLGLRHYSRSDFIVSSNGIYILETNTLPELTENSLYLKSLEAVGLNLKEFNKHLINLVLSGK